MTRTELPTKMNLTLAASFVMLEKHGYSCGLCGEKCKNITAGIKHVQAKH